MFRGIAEYISLGLISLRPKKEAVHRDIYGREVEHADDFFHPQKFRGIPVFDADSILMHYKPQLERLREVVDIGDHRTTPDGKPLFEELFLNVIKRFITFVHMIPASEDHHHKNTGGLLTHSIEASIESLRWSKELKCQVTHMPDLDSQIKPIIDYSSWLGGLLHDVGKIMRDISVDAVEIIHPLTKRPVPMMSPILSWHPQKQSLTEWAKFNNISAYSVTWLRHRTHNRHNIDSGQILQPLLHGTFALDYLLSSPIKQEVYSELVRCLSGYTHQKGHVSDCMRMGDSVSTNRALSIQYDPVRGYRRVSTATKLYHCINHARKDWEWNRPKSQAWVIGGEAYIRWTAAIDAIIAASIDRQYGLPTDTRNILTIMESNGFTHLFDPECPNDRILKFVPGNFSDSQKMDIVSGKKPVAWIDLIKMVTPHVVFGENPVPPSMGGIIYLPNAKLFFYINKDGDIQPLNQTVALPLDEQGGAAELMPPPSETVTAVTQGQSAPVLQVKPKSPAKGAASKTKPKNVVDTAPALPAMLPKAAAKSSLLNAALFGDTAAPVNDDATIQSASVNDTKQDTPQSEAVLSNNDEKAKPVQSKNNDATQAAVMEPAQLQSESSIGELQNELSLSDEDDTASNTDIAVDAISKSSTLDNIEPQEPSSSLIIPKGITLSDTFKAILDKSVIFYKTERAVLIDANDAEAKLSQPLPEILKSLKAANELLLNPMKPAILTVMHDIGDRKVKCMSLAFQLTRIFTDVAPGVHNDSNNTSNTDEELSSHDILNGKGVTLSIIDQDTPPINTTTELAQPVSIKDNANNDDIAAAQDTSFVPAALPLSSSIEESLLRAFITPKTAYRYDGHIYLNVELLCQNFAIEQQEAIAQLNGFNALYTSPLEPVPQVEKRKHKGSLASFVKLSASYDDTLPRRAAIKPQGGGADDIEPKKVAKQEKAIKDEASDYAISLTNLAQSTGPASLIAFLTTINEGGLLTYLDNGKISIELSAIPSSSYRPFGKSKIMHYLLNHGGEKQGTHIHITVDNLTSINLEHL